VDCSSALVFYGGGSTNVSFPSCHASGRRNLDIEIGVVIHERIRIR